jgi:raffinose/stachyose/melibiose transport system substrate-binding protein
MRNRLATRGVAVVASAVLAACGSSTPSSGPGADGPSGTITVLTQRTDIVDSVFTKRYVPRFKQKYPKIDVKFEAITDYEGDVRARMNTKDYGDVLLIPNNITKDQLPRFFEPLGTVGEMRGKYRFTRSEQVFQGKVYGLAVAGNAQGVLYNKKVFAEAGVTTLPKTPDEFIAALKAVKAKTKAIPLYTNYSAEWPLSQWECHRGAISGDPEAVNRLAHLDAPWAPGEEHNVIDTLLYRVVKAGLTEPDPATTDWESSKLGIGEGRIATMVLGSWAVIQTQEKAHNKADIGYMPFPVNVNGTQYTMIAGDYKNAININSRNKPAARAWIDWFTDESDYAFDQGGIPTVLSAGPPRQYDDLVKARAKYLELSPEPVGEEGLVERIDTRAGIDLKDGRYRQRIVDAARGASKESLEEIFSDLDARWKKAKDSIE